MGKFIEFETREYARDMVPDHSQESLENYLMYGYHPGGFLAAMLAGELFVAANSADHANGPAMQGIANWIMQAAPHGSWGNREAVDNWCRDAEGRRTRFSDRMEKEYIVRALRA